MTITRIVVGIDGSTNATHAAEFAASLARMGTAPIVAVHAVGLMDRLKASEEPVPSSGHRDEIADVFETEWCRPLAGLEVEHRLVDGNPVSALLRTADQTGDVIVVGSRGAGGFPGLSLGSTSTQVAQHAHVPVVIVPVAADEA